MINAEFSRQPKDQRTREATVNLTQVQNGRPAQVATGTVSSSRTSRSSSDFCRRLRSVAATPLPLKLTPRLSSGSSSAQPTTPIQAQLLGVIIQLLWRFPARRGGSRPLLHELAEPCRSPPPCGTLCTGTLLLRFVVVALETQLARHPRWRVVAGYQQAAIAATLQDADAAKPRTSKFKTDLRRPHQLQQRKQARTLTPRTEAAGDASEPRTRSLVLTLQASEATEVGATGPRRSPRATPSARRQHPTARRRCL